MKEEDIPYPKDNTPEENVKFLEWCSENTKIEVWNKWKNKINMDLFNINLQSVGLENLNLENINFRNINLSNTSLDNTNLYRANFERANLYRTSFERANLQYTNFEKANLDNTNFQNTNLKNASLRNAILQYIDFQNANLQHVDFQNANLSNTDLEKANLTNANLTNTNLTNTNLTNVNLSYSNCINSNLEHANLENSNLEHANLENIDVSNISFNGANLRNTQFINCNLHQTDFRNAQNISKTVFKDSNWKDAYICNELVTANLEKFEYEEAKKLFFELDPEKEEFEKSFEKLIEKLRKLKGQVIYDGEIKQITEEMAISFLKIQSNLRKFVVDLKNVYISEKELEAFKLGFETKYNSNEKTFQVIFNYLNSEEAVKEVLRIVPKKDYAILTLGVVSGIVALNQDYNREITNFLKEKRESVEGLELGFVKKLLKIQETQLNLIPATFHFALKGTKDTKMITENGEIEEFSEAFLKESSKLLS